MSAEENTIDKNVRKLNPLYPDVMEAMRGKIINGNFKYGVTKKQRNIRAVRASPTSTWMAPMPSTMPPTHYITHYSAK